MFANDQKDADSLTKLLAKQIRRDILLGVHMPESELIVDELMLEYGGSSLHLIAALETLWIEGIIEKTTHNCFKLSKPKEEDISELLNKRAQVECIALECSLRKGNIHWQGMVVAAHKDLLETLMLAEHNPDLFMSALEHSNSLFHKSLISACDAPDIIAQQATLYQQSKHFRSAKIVASEPDFKHIKSILNSLVAAILDNNVTLSKQLLTLSITFR
ncbi:MAG: GntR family carbon starvation induced transcriptional regulator [Oceanospirillaceae bacterium]